MFWKVDRTATAFLHSISMLLDELFATLPTCTSFALHRENVVQTHERITRTSTNNPYTISAFSSSRGEYSLWVTFSFSRRNGRALRRTPVRQHSFYLHSRSLLSSKNSRSRSICTISHSRLLLFCFFFFFSPICFRTSAWNLPIFYLELMLRADESFLADHYTLPHIFRNLVQTIKPWNNRCYIMHNSCIKSDENYSIIQFSGCDYTVHRLSFR